MGLYINAELLCNVITECICITKCWGAKYGRPKCGALNVGAQIMGVQSG